MSHGITVQLLELGGLRGDESWFYRASNVATASNPNPDARWKDLVLWAGLIHHPEHGLFLYEAGGSPEPGREWTDSGLAESFPYTYEEHHHLDRAIAAAGHRIEDVAGIIVGHLHADHAGGLEFFRGTGIPLFVHEEELKNAFYGVATGDDPGFDYDYLDVHFNWVPVSGPSTQLVPGIELIHLPGHTLGLQGALIALDESDPLLFVSDHLIFEDHLEHQVPGFLNRDDHLWHESRRRVRNLVTNRNARIVYGHDPVNAKNFPVSPDVIR